MYKNDGYVKRYSESFKLKVLAKLNKGNHSNEKRAKEYETLKLKLAFEFKNDRGAYVLGKTDFVNETINLVNKK